MAVGSTPLLYHYTNNEGLAGILGKGELWLSHIMFLNDTREFKHACDVLAYNVRNYPQKYKEMWIENQCREEQFDSMIDNMHEKSSYEYVSKRYNPWRGHQFIFSMTQQKNALSQWRAYGNGEYAIEFDFKNIVGRHDINLVRVIYSGEKGEIIDEDVQNALGSFFESHIRHIHDDGRIDTEVFHDGIDDIIINLLQKDFFARHKNDGFAEEQEWRLVKYVGKDNESIFFTRGNKYPKPRFIIEESSQDKSILSAISGVMCGPGLDLDLLKVVMSMIKPDNSTSHIQLSSSKVPYQSY